MRAGQVQSINLNMSIHGTQTLLGGFIVAVTGIIDGLIQETRTEVDFVESIKYLIEKNPAKKVYHFIADQLNTHKSETLVRFVADFCNLY